MKDKTKWAKGLPDDELAAVIKRWPGTIADLQSGLSAALFEQRRRNRKAKEDYYAVFSAKRCAERLDRSSEND